MADLGRRLALGTLIPRLAHCVASGLCDVALGSGISAAALQGGVPRSEYGKWAHPQPLTP